MDGSGHPPTLAALPPVGLDVLKKRKHYLPTQIQNPDHPACSLIAIPNMLTKLLLLFHFFYALNILPLSHTHSFLCSSICIAVSM